MLFKLGQGTGGHLLLYPYARALFPHARCTYEEGSGSSIVIYSRVFHRIDLGTPWKEGVQKVVLFVCEG